MARQGGVELRRQNDAPSESLTRLAVDKFVYKAALGEAGQRKCVRVTQAVDLLVRPVQNLLSSVSSHSTSMLLQKWTPLNRVSRSGVVWLADYL